jgi:hypothetical protein
MLGHGDEATWLASQSVRTFVRLWGAAAGMDRRNDEYASDL